MKQVFILLAISLITFQDGFAQHKTDDNILWSSVKLVKRFDKNWSAALAPIYRLNQNISNYQNSSIDYSVRYTSESNWYVQALGRTWFIPDGDNIQFAWLDVGYIKKLENAKITSFLRWHNALDLNDTPQADFIRWNTKFAYTKMGKLQPFIVIEPWWRLNGIGGVKRVRYEPGVSYAATPQTSITLMMWRQETVYFEPDIDVNIFVATLSYKLK